MLLTSCLIDVLKPVEGEFPYYDLFLSRYCLITVTAVISQCNLMPEYYSDMTQKDMDDSIDGMINSIPKGAEKKRAIFGTLSMSAHIDPGVMVQDREKRIFASEIFVENAKKYSLSNTEMLLRGLNSSAFLNYFFLFEDVLKKIYIDKLNPKEKSIKGSEVISVCLKSIVYSEDVYSQFETELYRRSKFFFDFNSLCLMWDLLNFIRNQIAHANGFYDQKARNSFNKRFENLIEYIDRGDGCLSVVNLIDEFDVFKTQIEETQYLIVNDSLENIIRNISVFIMESLYICNKSKI